MLFVLFYYEAKRKKLSFPTKGSCCIFASTKRKTMTQSKFTHKRNQQSRRAGFRFLAGIELGVLSKDCERFGICKVEIIDQMIYDDCLTRAKAYDCLALIGIHESAPVDFFFLKQGMKDCVEKKHFAGETFLLEEDIRIEGRCTCSSDERTISRMLRAGSYRIFRRPWGYWVRIKG